VSDKRSEHEQEHASKVRGMFAEISARYDLLNHLLSGNMDKRWRRRVASELRGDLKSGDRILDVASGTGDLALTLFESTGARIVGTDFCRPMLELAARKALRRATPVPFVEGDALKLPFRSDAFDGVTIAFGLRNLSNVETGLSELFRVLKPGGRVAVLEFSKPVMPGFRALFEFYFARVLPLLGGIVSGSRSAYQYLPASVSNFPDQERLASMMVEIGFEEVEYQNLTGGIAAIHSGTKPQGLP
jgi:demethylmenaquinone methyltransferase/2-methoxy-6-polyprenyl-1,4-benzoquinol methylase